MTHVIYNYLSFLENNIIKNVIIIILLIIFIIFIFKFTILINKNTVVSAYNIN